MFQDFPEFVAEVRRALATLPLSDEEDSVFLSSEVRREIAEPFCVPTKIRLRRGSKGFRRHVRCMKSSGLGSFGAVSEYGTICGRWEASDK